VRVFNRYFTRFDFLLLLGDVACVLASSVLVRAHLDGAVSSSHNPWPASLLHGIAMALVVVIAFYYSNFYAIDQILPFQEVVHRFIAGVGASCIVIAVVSYPIPNFGKSIYISEMVLMCTALGVWRFGFMSVLKHAGIRAKVLIVGIRAIGKIVAEELYLRRKLGMEVVGFVGGDVGSITLSYGNPKRVEIPVFAPSALPRLIASSCVDRILVASSSGCPETCYRDLVNVRAMGVPIEDCHSFYERLSSKISVVDLPPEWIALSRGFRRDRFILATKRIIDVIVSFIGLVIAAPLVLITVIAIRIESRGPIFYRQERIGQNERCFTLIKFRSMAENAEVNLGPVWAKENDPRVTKVGAIIRKLRIDEIPQMFNVLKGEMSFVGPRPERPFFVETLKEKIPYYDLRHTVKPGITGWAQISYRYGDSERDALEKLQYDLYYIKHMSPVFDLQIIFESLKVILFGSGAR
jgi:sugar transferase (PEP-CTERM system associated)